MQELKYILVISFSEVPVYGPNNKKQPAPHHFLTSVFSLVGLQSVRLQAHGYEYSVLTYNAWYLGAHSGTGLFCHLPFPLK